MGLIKIKLSINGNTFEAEGERSEVEEMIKSYFLLTPSAQATLAVENEGDEVSVIFFDLVQKDKLGSEPELMLALGYYINKDTFSRENLLQAYKGTKTYTVNRSKSLSLNLKKCVKKDWFQIVGQDMYAISPNGQKQLKEMFGR